MISKEKIDEIIEKTDIVDLVSEYVKLEKSGSGYRGLCPFHSEKTPSFMVSPSKKIAKCMGCGGGGSPISFLMQIKNISYPEAIAELAKKNGIKIDGLAVNQKSDENKRLYEIMQTANDFYIFNLFNSKSGTEALDYLHKRGLNDEVIKKFKIGLAPSDLDTLYKLLKSQNYNEIDLVNLGLIKSSDKGFYDMFRSRIMFPICDEEGHTIAFSGRIYNTTEKNFKYVNSPETVIFKKSKTLFNLSNAIPEIRKSHRIVLHEGQMDVIASVRSGIPEAICSLGTSLTAEQVKIMSKYADEIIVCYDGDDAGLHAMEKAIKLIEAQNLKLKLVMLPDKKDPDEYVKEYGTDQYYGYFTSHQKDASDFMISFAMLGKNLNVLSDVEDIKNKIFEYLLTVKSQIIIEKMLNLLAEKINVSASALTVDFNKYCYKGNNFEANLNNDNVVDNSIPNIINPHEESNLFLFAHAKAELRLMNYAKMGKAFALKIENSPVFNGNFVDYLEPVHQDIWLKMIDEYYVTNDKFNEGLFIHMLDSKSSNVYINDIDILKRSLDEHIQYSIDDMEKCILALSAAKPKKEINKIENEFNNLSFEEKKEALNKKIMLLKELNKKRN